MSQATNWGVPSAPPSTTLEYAARDNASFDALLTLNSGSSRPSYAEDGMIWLDTSVLGTWSVKQYDGTNDRLLYTIDATTGIVKPAQQARVDVASAATTDLGAAVSQNIRITGTTTITGFGSAAAGTLVFCELAGDLQLTHNATSLILPNGGGNIAGKAGDSFIARSLGSGNWKVLQYQPVTPSLVQLGTVQASTSLASRDFTGIPSWARRVTVNFVGVSTSGTSYPIVQIGPSGGVETSGYAGASVTHDPTANTQSAHSSGALILFSGATNALHGNIEFELVDASTNTWSYKINVSLASGFCCSGSGSKSLSGVLDRLRVTTTLGSDTFDAGKINVTWQ